MHINIAKKDIYWSYLNYGANVLSNMIILVVAIVILPEKELGMWYTFQSVGAIVQLIDFGFLPCITRNISFAWVGAKELRKNGIPTQTGDTNFALLKLLIYSSKYIYMFLSIFVLLIGGIIGTGYILTISEEINLNYLLISWLVYVLSLICNIYFGYWAGCLQGVGAIKENNEAKVISFITLIIVTIVFLYCSFGLMAMAGGYLISGIVYRLIAKYKFSKQQGIRENEVLHNEKFSKSDVASIIKIIWPNSWRLGINSISTYLITQGNTLLCSGFLGLSATATYGLSLQICTAIITIAKILMTTYQPQLIELNLKQDKGKIRSLLGMIIAAYWGIVLAGGIAFLTIGIPIIGILKPSTFLPRIVVLYMLVYLALEGNHSCFGVYLTTKNEVPFVRAGVISAFSVFGVSLLLVWKTNWGIWALMLGQSLVQLVYNNWKWPKVVMTDLELNWFSFMKIGINELWFRSKVTLKETIRKSRK